MQYKWDLTFKTTNFNIKYTLDCGQCFRWKELYCDKYNKCYEYIGVIEDRVIKLRQEQNTFYVSSSKLEKLKEVVFDYFDLNQNYNKLEKEISKVDENIKKAVKYSSGLHILNQPVFETMISYIISANNNIKRISGSIEKIAKMFGKEINFEGEKYYLFPTMQDLSKATNEDMLSCGVGFRSRYIVHTVEKLKEPSNILCTYINKASYELKKELLTYMGIGQKVADCIMLFSMNRGENFPIDVWVKRVMEKLYMRENTSIKEITTYAEKNFGKNAGLIQQHLFYNIRENNI